jgi:hypothetical protein
MHPVAVLLLCLLPAAAAATTSDDESSRTTTPTAATILHVCAVHGDDTNTGAAEAPLRTLVAARDAARQLRALDGPMMATQEDNSGGSVVEIALHGVGVHQLLTPLVLDGRDSYTNWKAAPGSGPVLVSGGIRVEPSAILPRAGHDGQFQVNMTTLGLDDLGTVLPGGAGLLHPQLFINEQSGLLARWPNARNQSSWQWAYTKDCISATCTTACNCSAPDIDGFSWRTTETNGSGVPPAVAHKWSEETDAYVRR